MSKLFRIAPPFEFSVACSARFRRSAGTLFLPVVNKSATLSVEGRAVPEYERLTESAKEELLPALKFARRQYLSNFLLDYSAEDFNLITEKLRRKLNFPTEFIFNGGVRVGANHFRKASTEKLGADCISLYGEGDCLLVRETLNQALRGLGLDYSTVPVYFGGVKSEWAEIIPEFFEYSNIRRAGSPSTFLKATDEPSLYLSVEDESSIKELRPLFFPLVVDSV